MGIGQEVARTIEADSLQETLKQIIAIYAKRKRVEMDEIGVPVDAMKKRYETMKDWVSIVFETARIENYHERNRERDALRCQIFGPRFDDVGTRETAVEIRRALPLCRACGDSGLSWGHRSRRDEGERPWVVACACNAGRQRARAIKELGEKKATSRKRPAEDF